MRIVILEALFALAASTITFNNHFYVEEMKTWLEAQQFCREHYTDLSPLSLEWGKEPLRAATSGEVWGRFWIGLYVKESEWRWSGAGPARNITWDKYEPTRTTHSAGSACWDCQWEGLRDSEPSNRYPFFCVRFEVVATRRLSWESALRHCAQTSASLVSLSSEAEQLIAVGAVERSGLQEPVWIGMRFLGDHWLWVDGSARQFEAWDGDEAERLCPALKGCGALSAAGLWENRDCAEELYFICSSDAR